MYVVLMVLKNIQDNYFQQIHLLDFCSLHYCHQGCDYLKAWPFIVFALLDLDLRCDNY